MFKFIIFVKLFFVKYGWNKIMVVQIKIVLFKSIRNSKRRNKVNFTSKFKVVWGASFWNSILQTYNISGLQNEAQSSKNQVFSMFLKKVTSIFQILGLFPSIAKIEVLTRQLLEDLTGSFFNLQEP